MKIPALLLTSAFVLSSLLSAAPDKQPANGKLKVFILAGQSNMVGFGQVEGDKGFHYAETIRITKEVVQNLETYFPDYRGNGYEIVGFGWHQGWNDRIDQNAVDAYEQNLVHLIEDLREDIGVADLPFVVANSGFDGWEINKRYRAKVLKHLNAQLAVADAEKYPDFEDNVAAVETRDFYRPSSESPSKQGFHWSRNWETFYLIGDHMGEAMIGLLSTH